MDASTVGVQGLNPYLQVETAAVGQRTPRAARSLAMAMAMAVAMTVGLVIAWVAPARAQEAAQEPGPAEPARTQPAQAAPVPPVQAQQAQGQAVPGQGAPVPQAQPSKSGLTVNPAVALREFEPSPTQEYELGRGDEISINVTGRPEMNTKDVIGPDGKITLPLVGSILLADKTREQAAEAVEAAYKPFYASLTVTVGVDRYTSNQILLLGAVEHPGIQTFDRPPTLLEVVSRGGAVIGSRLQNIPSANSASYQLSSNLTPTIFGVPERCAIYRGNDKVLWVELKSLLDSGSPLADLRLKREDIVYVPSPAERYVSVLGQIQHPGALQLDNSSTLPKLIALAGGLTPQAGHNPQIQIIQPSTGKTRVISWNQVLQPSALDLTLQTGDIVFVPESGFNRAAYTLDKLSPLVTLFTAAAFIGR
jgi:polysaccharide export outer membrane protein